MNESGNNHNKRYKATHNTEKKILNAVVYVRITFLYIAHLEGRKNQSELVSFSSFFVGKFAPDDSLHTDIKSP